MTIPGATGGDNFGELYQKFGQGTDQFKAVPPGYYEVEVKTAKAQKTKDGLKPQLLVQFKIVDHPEQSGRPLTNNFTVSDDNPNSMAFFFRHMAALGLTGDFWAQGNGLEQAAAQLPGRRARVRVTNEKYDNQDRAKVKDVMPPTGLSAGGFSPAPRMSGLPVPPPPVAQVPPVQDLMKPPVPAPAAAPAVPEPAQASAPEPQTATPAVEPEQPKAPVPASTAPPAVPF